MTDPLGRQYFELCEQVPLRLLRNEGEFTAAELMYQHLMDKHKSGSITPDEIEYFNVLDLIISEYSSELDVGTDLDEEIFEPAIAEEAPEAEIEEIVEEFEDELKVYKEEMQPWDFVQLCNNLSTVLSKQSSDVR